MVRCVSRALHETRGLVSSVLLLLLLVGCGSPMGPSEPAVCVAPDATAQRQVIVEVPEVYELANVILALTNYQLLASHTVLSGPYLAEVRAHFDEMRGHPLVGALNARLTGGGTWNYDTYYGFRENSFSYDFGASRLIRKPAFTRPVWSNDVFSAEIQRVEDFASRSAFRAFYAGRAGLYEDQIRRYEELVAIDRMWLWLEARFPNRYDRYRIVFSPLINGSHSTQRITTGGIRETIMFISGPDVLPDSMDSRMRSALLERVVFTEIDHNYVNPVTDGWEGRVERVFDDVSFWNGDANYRSPVATFNEYMTWAVFNLYARDTYDPATGAAVRESVIRNMVQGRRFYRFREFEQVVMEAYAAAGSQPCIPNLYAEILDRAAALR